LFILAQLEVFVKNYFSSFQKIFAETVNFLRPSFRRSVILSDTPANVKNFLCFFHLFYYL